MRDSFDDKYDLPRILVRPLYFGLVVNIVLPMALLFVCYYFSNNFFMENRIGSAANSLFYVFVGLALVQAGVAFWWRKQVFDKPMIRREQTFEQDLSDGLVAGSRPVFVVIAAIAVYGYVYFYLTGRFHATVVLVLMSFIAFQVVRPRMGSLRKLITYQQQLVKGSRFRAE